MKYELRKNDYKYYETVNLPHTLWRVSTNTMLVAILGISFFVTGYFCPRCASFDLVPKFETSQKSGDHVENMELIPNIKYILLWTPKYYAPFYFYKDGNRIFTEMKCAWTSCYVTANRNLLGEDVTKFHAIAFNGRSDNIDPPKARSPRQKYIFFNMESADNYPVCSSRWDGFFNWTATYRLDSDIPFPYIQIKNQRGQVVGPKPNMKWQDADSDVGYDYRQNKTKAVAWFVSNCKSRSDRGRVAADLAEALKRYGWTVDIYGSCGDHSCPRFDKKYDCGSVLKRDYFFYLSFENSFSEDYVTEKLLTALQHDVVPIVLGGADYSRFLPPGSYLNAGNINSEDLASAIDRLIRSPSEYKKFFRWKTLYWYRNPSTPDSVCAMCAALHNHTLLTHFTSYSNFRQWWNPDFERRCAESNSSGALVPPYDYNGFIAKLEFLERQDASDPTPTMAVPSQPLAALVHPNHNGDKSSEIEVDALSNEISTSNGRVGCGATVRGYGPGGVRSGHFDTRTATWRAQCAIHLIGTPTDVIQVSLFNYNLRLQSCRSHIEILEGLHELSARGDRVDRSERIDRALLRVCGPAVREARDPAGRFLVRQAVTSKGSNVTIFVRRASSRNVDEEEFVDGGFAFHDEQHEGTVSPDATCAATHYGLSSPPHGGVSAPSHHHIFWNIEERLICTHRFIPASNQSVTIEIQRLERMWSAEPPGAVAGGGGCRTACGDAGCECRALTPLTYHDHIALVAGDGTHLSCLCGDFQAAWLPVVVRSWTSLRLEYSVAHYTYASRGFDYAAAYSFNNDAMCGQRTYTTHSGEISSKNVSVTGSLNEFFYQQCTWVLDSNVERQLFIDISSEQDKSCSSWNITLHEWSGLRAHSEGGLAATAGELLYTFCARHKNHTYTLPWRLNTVVIRLVALSRQQPLYSIRWRSQVVRANNRLGPPTPAPAAAALAPKNTPGIYSIGLIVVYIYLGNK